VGAGSLYQLIEPLALLTQFFVARPQAQPGVAIDRTLEIQHKATRLSNEGEIVTSSQLLVDPVSTVTKEVSNASVATPPEWQGRVALPLGSQQADLLAYMNV